MSTICLIPGDGVGQEVIPAAAQVLATVLPGLHFVEAEAGWACFQRHGTALPEATLAAVADADATLFGATQSPSDVVAGYRSPILALRRHFDLYANLRPAVALPGSKLREKAGLEPIRKVEQADHSPPLDCGPAASGRFSDRHLAEGPSVDLLIVRENTEGLYSGRERREGDTAIAERVITRRASERIARVACEQARRRIANHGWRTQHLPNTPFPVGGETAGAGSAVRNPKLTIVHKANVLKLTDGLFRESCLAMAAQYPDVAVEEMLVDTAAMWLVVNPRRFDVIVTTNLFGDILSDLASGLVGGLGVAPSANLGAGQVAVFEPVHGSAPDIAGRGIANPIGAILSAAMLLDHLNEHALGDRVRRAVADTIAAGIVTPDLGGEATTMQVVEAVCRCLA